MTSPQPPCRNVFVALSLAIGLCSTGYTQEPKLGKLKVSVSPPEAYTFVDDKAIGPGFRSIPLSEGKHTLFVTNYGYKSFEQDVSVAPGQTASVRADLQPAGAQLSGPWGRIQIEVGSTTRGDYAVLLNGKTPPYFVGHVDEFNHNIWWKQELIVPPGTHEVTVTRHGQVAWSGKLAVAANQRVIVDISNDKQKVKDWPRGAQLGAMNRFKAGIASASVVIAPVSGTIGANPSKIDCDQVSQLKWTSAETIDSDISGMSPVPPSGEKGVSPKKTTTYDFTSTGPGGVVKASTTVDVNPIVVAQLETSSPEVRYQRIGEKVIAHDTATLKWSTMNSSSASIDPIGSVDPQGTLSVQPVPAQTTEGPINETVSYTLHAANACGGSDVKTVSIHLTGSIAPAPIGTPNSIFFPTDYPDESDPTIGLLQSQKDELAALAAAFAKYLDYNPDARLSVSAFADERGSQGYNQSLSERRAQSVKDYLIAQGVPADKIDSVAHGKDQPLDESAVAQLQTSNPNPAPESRLKYKQTSWLAYNRRVDVTFLPDNKEPSRFYPNNASDADTMWQRPKPDLDAPKPGE